MASEWTPNGNQLTSAQGFRGTVPDHAGGFYLLSATRSLNSPGFDGVYYLRRFRFDGGLSLGWPAGGLQICNAPRDRTSLILDAMRGDGSGGVLITWLDYRSPNS